MVSVGEGTQAASDECHGAEAGTGRAGTSVGAGGILLAMPITIAGRLEAMVGAGKGHLHARQGWLLFEDTG